MQELDPETGTLREVWHDVGTRSDSFHWNGYMLTRPLYKGMPREPSGLVKQPVTVVNAETGKVGIHVCWYA